MQTLALHTPTLIRPARLGFWPLRRQSSWQGGWVGIHDVAELTKTAILISSHLDRQLSLRTRSVQLYVRTGEPGTQSEEITRCSNTTVVSFSSCLFRSLVQCRGRPLLRVRLLLR